MVKHELYINDILVDIDKDVNIYPLYQSPLLTDLKSIVSNRTNNISLPMTPQNVKAIQMFHLADTTDGSYAFPRQWCAVRYFRNGFNICNEGQGMITGISGGRINFAFTWGASSKLQDLFDKKLADLDFGIIPVPWESVEKFGYCNGFTNKVGYFMVDYGYSMYDFNYNHPCVTSSFILSLIELNNNIKIDRSKISTPYLIPCIKRPKEDLSVRDKYFSLKDGVPLL